MKTFDASTLISLFRAGDTMNAPVLFDEVGYYDAQRAHRDEIDRSLQSRGGYVHVGFNKLHHVAGSPVEVEVSVWVGRPSYAERRQVYITRFSGESDLAEMIEAVEPHIAAAQGMLRGEREMAAPFAPSMDDVGGVAAVMARTGLVSEPAPASAMSWRHHIANRQPSAHLPTGDEARRIERSGLHPTDFGYDDPDASEWGF